VFFSRARLQTRLEHEVERRLRRAAQRAEAATENHVAQSRLTGLRTERETDFLRARCIVDAL
jgi:hypothetical protein